MRFLISIVAIAVSASRLCSGLLRALYKQQSISIFERQVVGLNRKPVRMKVLKAGNTPLADIDLWLHYLKGDINLVGPRMIDRCAARRLTSVELERFAVAPGMISPYQVQCNSGIAHKSESTLAVEFAKHATFARRVQILMAATAQAVLGNARRDLSSPSAFTLFGVTMCNTTMEGAVDKIMAQIDEVGQPQGMRKIAFVNADCVNKYIRDEHYKEVLNHCDHVFADGIGVRLAARWHGARLVDNVNGTDMFPILCERLSLDKKRVFLYGGRRAVVDGVAKKLAREYAGIKLVGAIDGYSCEDNVEQICEQINQSRADIVFIAKGAPLQEQWMSVNACRLNIPVAIGVGGLFDFYSGQVARAPLWVRELSLEWVWRLLMQPKDKAKRYLIGTPIFLLRLVFSNRKEGSLSNVLEVCQ